MKVRKIREVAKQTDFEKLDADFRSEYFRTTGWEFNNETSFTNGWVIGFKSPARITDLKKWIESMRQLPTMQVVFNEEWRFVKDEPDYMVSSLGRILRILPNGTFRLKATTKRKDKYHQVIFGNNRQKLAHIVVATSFCNNPQNKPCVNHKDGNKSNNKAENLEWVTHLENTAHAIDNNLMPRIPKVLTDRRKAKQL